MAGKAREFVARFLTDLSRFNTDPATRGLEDVGRASGRADDDLDRLDTTARDTGAAARAMGDDLAAAGRDADRAATDVAAAGRSADTAAADLEALGRDARTSATDLETTGDAAKAAAGRVDDAFDRIRAASRQGARGVDDSTDRMKDNLGEVGDEGRQVALELGASFDGSAESVADSVQDLTANVAQSFGAVGVVAGVAAAAGFGIIRAQAEALKEETNELTSALLAGGGRLEREGVLERLRVLAEDGTIRDLAADATKARVPMEDYLLAVAGDPAALERTVAVTAKLREELDAQAQPALDAGVAVSGALQAQSGALADVEGELRSTAEAYGLATEATAAYQAAEAASAEATGLSVEAQGNLARAVESFVDPVSAYTDVLADKTAAEQAAAEATAAATEDATDSWEDYARDVSVTFEDYMARLEEQVAAQESWAENMANLAGRVSEDTLEELARLGPEGAPLIAELVERTDGELARMDGLVQRRAATAVGSVVAELDAGAERAGNAGRATAGTYARDLEEHTYQARRAAGTLARQVSAEIERTYRPVVQPVLDLSRIRQNITVAGSNTRGQP